MSETQKWQRYLAERKSLVVLLVLTMDLTVFADLGIAISGGVALGLALRLQRRSVPADWSEADR